MEAKPGDLEGSAESSSKIPQKEAAPAAPSEVSESPAQVDDVPDPDEDDLDDLDDMLDEFTPETKKPTIPAGKPKAPAEDPLLGDEVSDDDFANQLQAGMADLLGELDSSPEMKAQFENMLKELGGAGGLGAEALGGILTAPTAGGQTASSAPSTDGSSKPQTNTKFNRDVPSVVPQDESFQDTIKKTMERMKASGDSATAAATSDNSDDLLAEMMKAMGNMDGEGSEEDFSKMLLGMMEQLTNKEILYEPMKELHDKFPSWMKKNAGKVDAADMKRYKEQQVYVREIVGKFEEKTYRDENVKDREYIVERMQNMQAAGSPPPDLVGDMAAAQEAFGGIAGGGDGPEEGCPTQ